jgi:PmbA protein
MTPTTGGFSNVVVEPGSRAPAAMAAGIEKGLWVTRFLGGNSNSLTGDFSAGVAGFLVEKGRVGRPVAEVNVAGRLQDLLLAVAEVGDDPYPYSSIRMPSLLVRGIAVSGT